MPNYQYEIDYCKAELLALKKKDREWKQHFIERRRHFEDRIEACQVKLTLPENPLFLDLHEVSNEEELPKNSLKGFDLKEKDK